MEIYNVNNVNKAYKSIINTHLTSLMSACQAKITIWSFENSLVPPKMIIWFALPRRVTTTTDSTFAFDDIF